MQDRIRKSIEFSCAQKKNNPQSKFFTRQSGLAWQPTVEKIDYDALILKGCSDFPAYLQQLLSAKDQYLDELAGVDVGHVHPEVEGRFKKMYKQAPPPRVVGHDLKLGRHNEEIGGTVVALHQYISPKFLAYYTVDHDASCAYMVDLRSHGKKERKIRFSSVKHVNTKPLWIQFGESTNVWLYLSQKASVAEEAWLSIVNHVMELLVEFVNSHIKLAHGRRISKDKLLRLHVFTELVSGISQPINGNYGPHGDDRNGTVSKNDPQFNRFLLMVPTLCLQNYAQETTRIEWCPRDYPGSVVGYVLQFFCLIHIQLLGVQEYFKHAVRCLCFRPP